MGGIIQLRPFFPGDSRFRSIWCWSYLWQWPHINLITSWRPCLQPQSHSRYWGLRCQCISLGVRIEQVSPNALLLHNTSFSSEGRLGSFQARSLIYRVVSLTLLGSKAKPEVLGALSEVCLEFSPSNSEDGAVYPGVVPQLHSCPDHRSPYVASCEVLPILRGHAALLGVTPVCPELLLLLLSWDATLGTAVSLTHTHNAWHTAALGPLCAF